VEVRRATCTDLERIHGFYQNYSDHEAHYYRAGSASADAPTVPAVAEQGARFLLDTQDGIVGLIHVEEVQTPTGKHAEIVDFIVAEAYRQKRAGSRLIDAAKTWARERGLKTMELFVPPEAKEKFYFCEEHKGFVSVADVLWCKL